MLVHEAIYFKGLEELLRARISQGFPVNIDTFMAHMRADHSPVEDIGRIAEEAGVKTLVISHLVPAIDNDDTRGRLQRPRLSKVRSSSRRI